MGKDHNPLREAFTKAEENRGESQKVEIGGKTIEMKIDEQGTATAREAK